MKLVFDIETDNYLELCTVIHCIAAEDYDTGKVYSFGPDKIKEGLQLLKDADMLIGHNILAFDIPAIKKLYPKWDTQAELYDTLIAAKFAFPDIKERDFTRLRKIINLPSKMRTKDHRKRLSLIGKHSLEAYGDRLGEYKGDFGKEVGFDKFSQEMMDYCIQDVKVNTKLFHKINSLELPKDILQLEFKAKQICLEQTAFCFRFDIDKAEQLKEKLNVDMQKLQDEVKSKLGGPFVIPLEVKVPTRTVNYKTGRQTKGAAFTKILIKDFNPTSRHDLTTRLIERMNWKPREFGKDGNPTLSEEVMKTFTDDIFKTIADMFTIQKRMGMLVDGQNAWFKMYNEDTKAIHGNIDTLGTGTHRCTHSRPNLGQIPSTRAPYGKECRELFTVPENWKLFGTDASGLELRMLAHYMFPFDNGEYADVILNGDIHTVNQEAAGLPTRNNAKTFIYAFLYGAGDAKIGSIIGGSRKAGKELKHKFFEKIPAMKKLTDAVKEAAEFRGYVKSLDGRRIPVRSAHSALNFLLQSSGAIVCKYWMVRLHELLKESGFVSGIDYKQSAFVHDELQIAFDPKRISGDKLGELSRQAMFNTRDKLKVRIPLDIDYDIGDSYADTH